VLGGLGEDVGGLLQEILLVTIGNRTEPTTW
jgi:hypothetical protein